MAKYFSRRQRCEMVRENIESVCENLESVVEDIRDERNEHIMKDGDVEDIVLSEESVNEYTDKIEGALGNLEVSDLDSLHDEIDSWAIGLEGTNLENSAKYEMLSECRDHLQDAANMLECMDYTVMSGCPLQEIEDEIEEMIQTLRDAVSELESCEFPGMFD